MKKQEARKKAFAFAILGVISAISGIVAVNLWIMIFCFMVASFLIYKALKLNPFSF
ncbi:hypothetical protein KKA15_05850 [Patescibacteria group bacterium]|nr:hypothetical protein [Patescibacteria group bacterium]